MLDADEEEYHGADAFEYYEPAFFRNDGCMVCRTVGAALEEHLRRDWRGVAVATWQPVLAGAFLDDNYRLSMRDDRGFTPDSAPVREAHCVLPLYVRRTERRRRGYASAFEPLVLELTLRYDGDGRGLRAVDACERTYFDTDRVKAWLARCEEKHAAGCGGLPPPAPPSGAAGYFGMGRAWGWFTGSGDPSPPAPMPQHTRLIHTRRRCVVDCPGPPVRFFALSYVWNLATVSKAKGELKLMAGISDPRARNLDALAVDGALASDLLPEVIDDAIRL